MRLRKAKDIAASVAAAERAREDANARLADLRDVTAIQKERARHERATIIASLRKMREANNLARLIMDTVEREAGNDAGAAGGGSHE